MIKTKYVDYFLTEDFQVYSALSGKVLKGSVDSHGYVGVTLQTEQGQKRVKVHRLVAETVLPLKEGKTQVNHKNGDKQNNHPNNLEWCTPKENTQHAIETGLSKINTRFEESDIHQIHKLLKDGLRVVDVARKYGVDNATIAQIRTGKSWSHIAKQYKHSGSKRERLSPETVRLVCSKLESGLTAKEVYDELDNSSLTVGKIQHIKKGHCYKHISKDYDLG